MPIEARQLHRRFRHRLAIHPDSFLVLDDGAGSLTHNLAGQGVAENTVLKEQLASPGSHPEELECTGHNR